MDYYCIGNEMGHHKICQNSLLDIRRIRYVIVFIYNRCLLYLILYNSIIKFKTQTTKKMLTYVIKIYFINIVFNILLQLG